MEELVRQNSINTGDVDEAAGKKSISLTYDIDDVLNYAIVHNGTHIIRDISVKNNSEDDLDQLTLKITSDDGLIRTFELGIEKIKPEEELHFKKLDISVDVEQLISLTEKRLCQLTISIYQQENQLTAKTTNITALAFDQWPGLQYSPELLAAFSLPNHPVVTSMIQLAAKYLGKWTGDPSLAGYQYKDPNRVKNMAAAAFAAIQEKNITYAEPPSSFETFGQRIRLADAVLEQHLGTCMDMTLLYAACLEAMGLNPILIMMKGHIFAGLWLTEESFPDMIMDDPSQLEKRMSKGIHEIVVVECTAMCAGKKYDFDDAVSQAEKKVSDYESFAFVIDIKRARSMGIHPLPTRKKTINGFEVEHDDRNEEEVTDASRKLVEVYDLPETAIKTKGTKITQWERKLLDLSLRNMLINMRLTKAVVPILSSDLSGLEDALSDGEEFQVKPRPADMTITSDTGVMVESLGKLGVFSDYIALESKHRRLHSLYAEKELNSCLTKMYRSARTSLEENGANTLYLALGLLRWYESKNAETARYAPIVLIPIDIIRKSANKGYTMRMRDEDAQINITLLEYLKQNRDIQIPGLTPPPVDEHGLDISKVFAIIRHAVMDLPMWDVIEVSFIGNFSFSQFVMWNDIHNNKAFLENNKIVHSLIEGTVDWDCTIPETVDTEEAYLPVTADASQLRAINMAAAGVSFVLHGPPGTGKSQTITAMIANALTKGKTVLFVAEKMAALDVVQRRLAALGIQDFCLELHSNKATKKSVLDQLKRGLEIDAWGSETDYDKKIQDIRRMRQELDSYATVLHVRRPFGKSLRQMMDIYEMLPEVKQYVHFERSYIETLTESDLDHQSHSLERLIAAGRGVGHPHNHPLAAIKKTEYSQRLKFELESVIQTYIDALKAFQSKVSEFASLMGLKSPATADEWKNIIECAKNLIAAEEIPGFLRASDQIDQEFAEAEFYLGKYQVFSERKAELLSKWNESFLHLEMGNYREKYDQANKKFFGKGKARTLLTEEVQAFAKFSVETDQIPVYLADVEVYQQEEKEIENREAELRFEWRELLKIHSTQDALQLYKSKVKAGLQKIAPVKEQFSKLEAEGRQKDCLKKAQEVLCESAAAETAEKEASELLDLSFDNFNEDWMEGRLQLCRCILDNAASIKDWIIYRQFEEECRQSGLGPICDAYAAGLTHDEVMSVYKRSIYRDIILSVIEKEPVLNAFTGIGFNEKIAQFKKLDQEFMELTKDEVYYKLTHQLPKTLDSVEISKELNILRRAISSNGRGLSIRSLFDQIPHILKKLCPCMLMSPISVAQYLKPENDLVDIVIFDEASQIPTCKAVGVLARGKNAVIVGDPNQMPPTSFFAGNTVDEDNLDIEDLDSILDDCLALGMPPAYLSWHYRSRHESLIAFSNREFYENAMLTFPSVNDRERRVKLVKLDGFFDRGKGRVNETEAKAIVEEIKRRYEDPELKNQTIGVVTFNISQQTLIEDMLQEAYRKDAAFDKWASEGDEPLFVKNLENVQGDERDIILFSIAFGPDAEGKLSLNFGPLNKEGGWKRLNVAASRARSEMVVFTIMTADMIDLKRTKSKGVEALKDFLEFAQKGRLQGEYTDTRVQRDQGIMEHICQALTDGGYKYQKAVGHSKFKIDIAVVDPYNPEAYLLGIMLDGESYRQSSNTKDREVAQISVLKGLGWELCRIWTLDWWDNREKVLSNLMQLLQEKKEEAHQKFVEAQLENAAKESETIEADNRSLFDQMSEEKVSPENGAQEEQISSSEEGSVEEKDTEDANTNANATDVADVQAQLVKSQPTLNESQPFSEKETVEENSEETLLSDEENTEAIEDKEYLVETYQCADIEADELSTTDYVKKENLPLIAETIQQIIDTEAPIVYDRLVKKTLRAFGIARSSTQTLEATDLAFKKVSARMNKQSGIRFYWRKDQDPEQYCIYRSEEGLDDRRSADEICQQELKNAVCITLMISGPQEKGTLIKNAIRMMGYSRSSAGLVLAVERGLKYGRKTGEIVQDEGKRFALRQ